MMADIILEVIRLPVSMIHLLTPLQHSSRRDVGESRD